MPAYEEAGLTWLEEPFPAHDWRSYRDLRAITHLPLAAGENHYTRFEFSRLIEEDAVAFLQPDISKTGGISETMRIAAMASAIKLPIHCHSSMGINMVATVHVLSAIENSGYFEADCSVEIRCAISCQSGRPRVQWRDSP